MHTETIQQTKLEHVQIIIGFYIFFVFDYFCCWTFKQNSLYNIVFVCNTSHTHVRVSCSFVFTVFYCNFKWSKFCSWNSIYCLMSFDTEFFAIWMQSRSLDIFFHLNNIVKVNKSRIDWIISPNIILSIPYV